MEVWLPAAMKAKLVRQVLVHKERGLIPEPQDLGEWQTPISESNPQSPLPAQVHCSFFFVLDSITDVSCYPTLCPLHPASVPSQAFPTLFCVYGLCMYVNMFFG